MAILSCEQTRALEQKAVDSGKEYFELMKKAGTKLADAVILSGAKSRSKITVLCGKGNNGGDGFIASHVLSEFNSHVYVVLTEGNPKTEEAKKAMELAVSSGVPIFDYADNRKKCFELIRDSDFIIDAIFGIGFRGKMNPETSNIAEAVNHSDAFVISADIPSGAECNSGKIQGECIKSDITVTFSVLKPCHVIYPSCNYCGKVICANAGIGKDLINESPKALNHITQDYVTKILPKRPQNANKGTMGTAFVVCGSSGMAGAGILTVNAALRSGCGLVKAAVWESIYPIMALKATEAVYSIIPEPNHSGENKYLDIIGEGIKTAASIVVGCGLGNNTVTKNIIEFLIKNSTVPLIIDADGLNVLADNIEILSNKNCPIILTPHPKEMSRLIKSEVSEIQKDRIGYARQLSCEYGITVVLKGQNTVVCADNGDIFINTNGNPGMAKGGSGDVLAGIIGSLCAQGMSANDSAKAGVYIHGQAGDMAAEEKSEISLLPTDIIEALPKVYNQLSANLNFELF